MPGGVPAAVAVPLAVSPTASQVLVLPFTATHVFAEPAPPSSEPYELVRALQAVQDGIANGDTAAHGSHLALIRQIGEKFLAADASVWSNPQNGQAVGPSTLLLEARPLRANTSRREKCRGEPCVRPYR